jgi:hypothetical protein
MNAWRAILKGKRKIVLCWHRGAGKDLFALNVAALLAYDSPGVYLHTFPQYKQGKRAIWDSIHDNDDQSSVPYLDHFPKETIISKNSQDMSLKLYNNSIYSVMGLDKKNAQNARGMNPKFIILSEYAYMDPESWYTLEPRISQNQGTVIFLSTPNGQNHFYHLYNYAKSHPDEYYCDLKTIDDTNTLPLSHIEKLRDQGYPEDFIQQEYYCSFTRGAEGAYYGKQIQTARNEERFTTTLAINKDLPVHTAWDIGISDSTAIFIFQRFKNGQIAIHRYYENSNESLEHYINYLDNFRRENNIVWGTHYVPHDMKVREFTTGIERIEVARQLGFNMTIVPDHKIDAGIQAVRSTLPNCIFHSKNAKRGIDCLDFYRKKWNDSLKVYYDEPLHDQFSHGADAFRYLAVGLKTIPETANLNSEKINEWRNKYLGY